MMNLPRLAFLLLYSVYEFLILICQIWKLLSRNWIKIILIVFISEGALGISLKLGLEIARVVLALESIVIWWVKTETRFFKRLVIRVINHRGVIIMDVCAYVLSWLLQYSAYVISFILKGYKNFTAVMTCL